MTKPQKQMLLANGFLAGLAELGVRELDFSNLSFEGPFLKAWRAWSPGKPASVLPRVEFGGTEQPRMILFRIARSTSPFKDFGSEGISTSPYGCSPREFLEDHCAEIPVEDWIDLARHFLEAKDFYDNAGRSGS
jgi:hypothetical protein